MNRNPSRIILCNIRSINNYLYLDGAEYMAILEDSTPKSDDFVRKKDQLPTL